MVEAVHRWLDSLGVDDVADRRTGHYRRRLLTELGDIELAVPRTRRYSPVEVVCAYARRAPEIDRVIMAGNRGVQLVLGRIEARSATGNAITDRPPWEDHRPHRSPCSRT